MRRDATSLLFFVFAGRGNMMKRSSMVHSGSCFTIVLLYFNLKNVQFLGDFAVNLIKSSHVTGKSPLDTFLQPPLQHHPVSFTSRSPMSHCLAPLRSLSVRSHEAAGEKKLTGRLDCKNISGCNRSSGAAESLKTQGDSANVLPPSTPLRSHIHFH